MADGFDDPLIPWMTSRRMVHEAAPRHAYLPLVHRWRHAARHGRPRGAPLRRAWNSTSCATATPSIPSPAAKHATPTARLGLALDLLLASPLVRARQTAEAVAAVLAIARGPEVCPDLAPGGDLLAVLAALGGSRRAMVIGHMPGLGQLVGLTVWGEEAIIVPFRTAGVARVDWGGPPRPGEGDLRWLLTPRLAARLR
jgi:phosphohistidine phosphatase